MVLSIERPKYISSLTPQKKMAQPDLKQRMVQPMAQQHHKQPDGTIPQYSDTKDQSTQVTTSRPSRDTKAPAKLDL